MKNIAVILAAGIGSRLAPITDKIPKSLVRVCGREIIDYQIQGYLKSGIREEDIFIVAGYKSAMFREYLPAHYPAVHVIENADYLSTNNMYSLYLALKTVRENCGNFGQLYVNNADCLYDESLMVDFVNSAAKNAIACEVGNYIEESMKIMVDRAGKITDIAKTIAPSDAFAVSIDLYKFSRETAETLFGIVREFIEDKNDRKQWSEVAFPALFACEEVFPFDISHRKWVEVDNMDDLLQADEEFSMFDFNSKKAYILDLDGTIFVGEKPIEGAVNFVKENATKFDFYFLTNNTSKTPALYIEKLRSFGIDCDEKQIATPLFPLVEYLRKFKSVYLVANDSVAQFIGRNLEGVELNFMPERNEAVILTYDNEIDYRKLKKASFLLNNKSVEYIATHTDVFCPTESGNVPDIGCLIETLRLVTGRMPEKVFGKPDKRLISAIVEKYGAKNVAVAGDRLYTDLLLAENSGVDFITVLSGETSRFDAAVNGKCKFIYRDLGRIGHGLMGHELNKWGGYKRLAGFKHRIFPLHRRTA